MSDPGTPSWLQPKNNQATPDPNQPSWLAAPAGAGQPSWSQSLGSRDTAATGGQRGSIKNGWNTDFYKTMFDQRDEADKAQDDPTKRNDFTGVVTYDNRVRAHNGEERNLRLGDVYEDGKYVENVYDYGKDQGNAILATLSFDAKEQQELYQGVNGDQTKLQAAIQQHAKDTTAAAKAGVAQQKFLKDREAVQKQWGDFAPIALALGGAGAGAAAGAGVGGLIGAAGAGIGAAPGAALGALIGGAVGAGGALLNQDELIDTFAAAQVQVDRANKLNNPLLAQTTAVKEYAGAIGELAKPLTNLGIGLVDASTGGVGDNVSVRENKALQDNISIEALRFGAGFADAIAQFAGPAGEAVYFATMGGVTAGGVGQLLTGQQWDDRKREFNPIADSGNVATDIGRWASAIGAVGIDAVQTFTPLSLLRVAGRAGGAAGRLGGGVDSTYTTRIVEAANKGNKNAETAARMLGLETKTSRVEGGRTFIGKEAADGSFKAERVSRVPNITMLAPSEAVGWMSVRAKALLEGAQGKAVTPEALYTASLQMRELPPLKRALLTGFSESTEEVVQSFLENWSGGYQPSFEELARAAAGGFVMGAGMSVGSSLGRNPVLQGLNQVNVSNSIMGMDTFTKEQWTSMTANERDRLRNIQPQLAAVAKKAQADMVDDNVQSTFNSYVLAAKLQDDAAMALESARQSGLPALERTWKISGINNAHQASNIVKVEQQALFVALQTHVQAHLENGDNAAAAALTQLLENMKVVLQRTLPDPTLSTTDVTDADITTPSGTVVPAGTNSIEAVNFLIREAYEGRGVSPAEGAKTAWTDEEARQAVELIFNRSPSDSQSSWFMARPEIDANISATATVGEPIKGWFFNYAVLEGISGDFDGDGTALRSFMQLGDATAQARQQLRLGLNLQTEDGAVIGSYAGEMIYSQMILMDPKHEDPNYFIQKELKKARDRIALLLGPSDKKTQKRLQNAIQKNLIDALIQAHHTDAKQDLWNWLSKTDLVKEASTALDGPVLFQINDIWLDTVFSIGESLAVAAGAKPPAAAVGQRTVDENGIIPPSQGRTLSTLQAATLAQRVAMATAGNDNVRKFQKLSYSPQTSQTLNAANGSDALEWMQTLYRILSSGTTRTQAELVTRVDEVAEYARTGLETLLLAWNEERVANKQARLTFADLGRLAVPNLNLSLGQQGVVELLNEADPTISVAQLVLRNAVQHFMDVDREVLDDNNGELRGKYQLLLNMDMKQALLELSGNMNMEDLIGREEADQLGWEQVDLKQVISDYINMNQRDRQNWIKEVKTQTGAYGTSESTEKPAFVDDLHEVTSYRVFVDLIETTGNQFITMDKTGLASENTKMGRQDKEAKSELIEGSRDAREYLRKLAQGLSKKRKSLALTEDELTKAQIEELFDLDEAFGRKVADLVPGSISFAVFNIDSSGHTTIPQYFYEYLTNKNSEEAAYRLWKGMLLAEMNIELTHPGNGVSSDRLVALFQMLKDSDPTGNSSVRFMRALAEETTIDGFLRFVNTQLNGFGPPQLAILRDQVAIDSNFSKGGWQLQAGQSDARKRISDMRKQIQNSMKNLNNFVESRKRDDTYIYNMRRGDPETMRLTEKAIARAKEMPSGTGPRTLINTMLSLAIGFTGNQADKAKAQRGTEGVGQTTQAQQYTWGSALNQLMTAYTSATEQAILARPDALLEEQTFYTADGTPVEWPGLTAELVRDLLEDPALHAMIMAAIAPTVFDQNVEEGSTSLQGLTKQSLHAMIIEPRDELTNILEGAGFAAQTAFLSMVDSHAGNNEVMMLAAKIFVMRTSGATNTLSAPDYMTWTQDALASAAKILRVVGQVAPGRREAATKLLADLSSKAVLPDPTDETLSPEARAAALAAQVAFDSQLDEALQQQLEDLTTDQAIAKRAWHERIKESLRGKTAGAALVKMYRIPADVPGQTDDTAEQQDAKRRLWNEINARGDFYAAIGGPDKAMTRTFLGLTSQVDETLGYPLYLPKNRAESQKAWDSVARALIIFKLGAGNGQVTASPEARATMSIDDPDFSMFFGDWAFVWDFATPIDGKYDLWDAANKTYKALSGIEPDGGTTEVDLLNIIKRELLENKQYPIGSHNGTIVQQYLNGRDKLFQSSAPEGIAIGGSNPHLNAALAAATRWTFEDPTTMGVPPRTYTFSSDDLWTQTDQGRIALTADDREADRDFGNRQIDSLGTLQGRFITDIRITKADGTALDWDLSPVKPWHTSSNVAARVTNPSQILEALHAAGVSNESAQIEVDFWYPEDQPEEFPNNIYFDGEPSGSGVDAGIGLIAADTQNHGLTQMSSRRALDALKKQLAAFLNPDLPKRSDVSALEDPNDVAGTIRRKVAAIMKYDADVTLVGPSGRNRIRKQILVQTILTGTLEDGSTVVYSAPEAIAYQKRGGTDWPPMTNVKLRTIPIEFVRTMLGDQSDAGISPNLDPNTWSNRIQNYDKWTGKWDRAVLEQYMPGLLQPELTPRQALSKSQFARTNFLRTSRPSNVSSTHEMDKYRQVVIQWAEDKKRRGADERWQPDVQKRLAEVSEKNAETVRQENSDRSTQPTLTAAQLKLKPAEGLENGIVERAQQRIDDMTSRAAVRDVLDAGEPGAAWILEGSGNRTPAAGYVNMETISWNAHENRQLTGANPVPGDIFYVDPEKNTLNQVMTVIEHGYKIHLFGSNKRAISDMKTALVHSGQVELIGKVWMLRNPMSGSQTALARQSALLSIISRKTAGMVGVFADQALEGEQAALFVDKEFPGANDVALLKTLVQSNAFPGFNRPGSARSRRAVMAHLANFAANPEAWLKHLATMTRISDESQGIKPLKTVEQLIEELREPMARAIRNTDPTTGLPEVDADKLKIGDFIFLVDNKGHVIINRHGHQAFQTQDSNVTKLTQLSAEGPDGPGNIVMYTSKLDDAPTYYEGVVHEWKMDSNGLVAEMRVPLSPLSDKMIFTDDGLKIFSNLLSNSGFDITKLQISDRIPLSYLISLADHENKEGVAIDSPFQAIYQLGFDMVEAYAVSMLGISSEDYRNGTDEKRADYKARVVNLFDAYQQGWSGNTQMHALDAEGYISQLAGDLNITPEVASLTALLPEDVANKVADKTTVSVENRITLAALTYLATPGAQVDAILSTAGVNSPTEEIKSMPELFTNFFRDLGQADPAREWFSQRVNERLPNRIVPNAAGEMVTEGYYLRPDNFMMEIRTPDQPMRTGLFGYKEAHSTGVDNGAVFSQSFEHSVTQGASENLRNMALLAVYGAKSGHDRDLPRFRSYLEGGAYDAATPGGLSSIFTGIQDKYIAPMNRSKLATPAEVFYQRRGQIAVEEFSQPFAMTNARNGWTEDKAREIEQGLKRLFVKNGLRQDDWEIGQYWIRRYFWRPKVAGAAEDTAEYGNVRYDDAVAALAKIDLNLSAGRFPTYGADVPAMHADEVSMFLAAYKASNGKGWIPTGNSKASQLTGKALDDYFYTMALGELKTGERSSLNRVTIDGFMQSYGAVFDDGVLPSSVDPLINLQLLDPDFNSIILAMDPNYRKFLKNVPAADVSDMRLSDVFGGTFTDGVYSRSYLSGNAMQRTRERQKAWLKANRKIDSVSTGADVLRAGYIMRTSEGTTNGAMRVLMNFRLANGMFHPWLFISAPFETAIRNTFENSVTLLSGEGFGFANRAARTLNDRLQNTAFGQSAVARALSPNVQPTVTLETMQHAENVAVSTAHDPEKVALLHQELYVDQFHNTGSTVADRFERLTERTVRVFGKWQDPSYGITPKGAANRLVGGLLRYFDEVGIENGHDADDALTLWNEAPREFIKQHPVAWQLMLNGVANARTIKSTSFSLFARSVINPLSSNTNPLINIPSNLALKIPFAFQNYAFNVATNMLGLQGLDAMLSLALQGRTSGKSWGRVQAFLSGTSKSYTPGEHGIDYLSNTLESINFADAFIRAGMTHTALAALGLVLGGLAGGDDEEKKRRRREEMLGVGHVYDPRDFQNDWRNADDIYLDGIPGLEGLFKVTDENGETHSPAELHWTLKQFISPIMGISKWVNTGNFNHLLWGFGDALGSMPLLNAMDWNDAASTAGLLMAKSLDAEQAAEDGTDASLTNAALQFGLDSVARLERMLFENSFINSVYVAADKYARDPWTLQDVDADGVLQRDNLDQPMQTDALNEYLDKDGNRVEGSVTVDGVNQMENVNPDGTFAEGSVSRDDAQGRLRSLATNRATLAFFGSLFTGFDSQNSLWRYNMAPREYSIEKQAVTQDDATALIVSEWQGNKEVLNEVGVQALLKSIHAGYLPSKDAPVLENIYLTYEQRQAAWDSFQAASIQDSLDLGFTEKEANTRWNAIAYGSSDTPSATPLFDVVWSKNSHENQIPYDTTNTYRQLNTTWVVGPDGKPWATGVARGELYNFFGQAPIQSYAGAGALDSQGNPNPAGNLGIDGRLNSTDEVGNVNTGMRSLEKVNATTANPTDKDILDSIKAASDRIAQAIKTASYANQDGGYTRYYGGSGSSGGSTYVNWPFMPFQNDMQAPYIDNVPNIFINNPSIRRDSVNRQRFSSDRGRLNPWQ